jgi:hypothetical protein
LDLSQAISEKEDSKGEIIASLNVKVIAFGLEGKQEKSSLLQSSQEVRDPLDAGEGEGECKWPDDFHE